ncbi:unnamed protein product, partial [Symbiodinium sp. CCMP2456]
MLLGAPLLGLLGDVATYAPLNRRCACASWVSSAYRDRFVEAERAAVRKWRLSLLQDGMSASQLSNRDLATSGRCRIGVCTLRSSIVHDAQRRRSGGSRTTTCGLDRSGESRIGECRFARGPRRVGVARYPPGQIGVNRYVSERNLLGEEIVSRSSGLWVGGQRFAESPLAAHDPSYYGDLLQGVLDVTCIRFAPHLLLPSLALLVAAPAAHAVPLLNTNASVLAINTSPPASNSTYLTGEGADSAIDGIPTTKYLNLGQPPRETGLAVEPLFGNTIAQSIQFTTADDFEIRDPSGWVLYGSNDPLLSTDNSDLSGGESWTQIANGALEFPADRLTQLPAINFTNSTPYNNYRIEFPDVKGGPGGRDSFSGMQVADVQLYTGPDATGTGVFGFGDLAIAYQLPQPASFYFPDEAPANIVDYAYTASSSYPAGENPGLLVDGDTGTKYLNFGGPNSGFIVTPDSPAQVQSFIVTSANDAIERHPTSWQLFGTNDPITSLDNSFGDAESWIELGSGSIEVPPGLFTDSPVVSVPNANAYSSYKMLFPTTNGSGLMQISEASFFTSTDGTGQDILEVGTPSLLAIDTNRGATKNFNA